MISDLDQKSNAELDAGAVRNKLLTFQPVRNQVLRWVVQIVPLAIITFILIDAVLTKRYVTGNPMFLTGLLAAALAAFLFRTLLGQIPETLDTIWTRNVLKPVSMPKPMQRMRSKWLNYLFGLLKRPRQQPQITPETCSDFEACYLSFVDHFENDLNRRFSWVVGIFFAAIMYVTFPYRLGLGWNFQWMVIDLKKYGWVDLLGCLTQVATAYILGLLVWRMIVVAWKVARLGQVFDFAIQIQHPDRSGGLKPLGNLCFSNALIITVPGIYLAGWLIATPHFRLERYNRWVLFYQWLLPLVIILAFLAFFQPLYRVHRDMVRQRSQLRVQLDKVSRMIDELTQRLLKEAELLTVDEREQLQKDLTLLHQVYESNSYIPAWPFDKNIVLKFISSQTIPLLSLSGLGAPFLKLVDMLLGFIQPSAH